MTIFSLRKIIKKDIECWETYKFNDSKLVIDCTDFCAHLAKVFQNSLFGGEYLILAVKLRAVFSYFESHKIEPYFIFRGCFVSTEDQQQHKLKYERRKIANLSKPLSTDIEGFAEDYLPCCYYPLFMDIIAEYGWKYIKANSGSVNYCAGISTILNCPLIASTTDYYILLPKHPVSSGNKHIIRSVFLPIDLIDFDSLSSNADHEEKDNSSLLTVTEFNRFNSDLGKLSSFHLPLFAVMLGTHMMSRIRLPDFLCDQIKNADPASRNETKYKLLIDWLSKFASNSIEPVNQILTRYSPHLQDTILNKLAKALHAFCYCKSDVIRLIKLINPKSAVSVDLNDVEVSSAGQESKDEQKVNLEDIKSVLNSNHLKKLDPFDVTLGWPSRFLDAYNKNIIENTCLAALYSPSVILNMRIENPKRANSIYYASFLIRRLHYIVMATHETSLNIPEKLERLNKSVVEYTRYCDRVVSYEIPISPILIDFSSEFVDNLLNRYLGLSLPSDLSYVIKDEDHGLFSFAIVLSFWFQHSKNHRNDIEEPFSQSHLTLAVIACALANLYNCESYNASLYKHYESLKTSFTTTSNGVGQCNEFEDYRDLVHQFNEMQSIYTSLHSLVGSLNHLLPHANQSKTLTFLSPWLLFPSGELVCYLAKCLMNEKSSARRPIVAGHWLPKLFFTVKRDQANAKKLLRMINSFNYVVDLCESMKIIMPKSLEKFYTIHEVPVPVPRTHNNYNNNYNNNNNYSNNNNYNNNTNYSNRNNNYKNNNSRTSNYLLKPNRQSYEHDSRNSNRAYNGEQYNHNSFKRDKENQAYVSKKPMTNKTPYRPKSRSSQPSYKEILLERLSNMNISS